MQTPASLAPHLKIRAAEHWPDPLILSLVQLHTLKSEAGARFASAVQVPHRRGTFNVQI